MTEVISQPTAMPTRKLIYGAVGAVVTAAVLQWAGSVSETYPALAFLGGPEAKTSLPIISYFLVGYMMKDRKA